jgi:hypothetical protein
VRSFGSFAMPKSGSRVYGGFAGSTGSGIRRKCEPE